MAQRSKKLMAPALLTASAATYYTAPTGVRARNLWLTVNNPTATAYTATVYIVPSGGSASATNTISYQKTILPGRTEIFYELYGHVLDPADFIQALASTNGVINMQLSGVEESA